MRHSILLASDFEKPLTPVLLVVKIYEDLGHLLFLEYAVASAIHRLYMPEGLNHRSQHLPSRHLSFKQEVKGSQEKDT